MRISNSVRWHIRVVKLEQMLTPSYHYTGWPDHGVPSDVFQILNVIKEIQSSCALVVTMCLL